LHRTCHSRGFYTSEKASKPDVRLLRTVPDRRVNRTIGMGPPAAPSDGSRDRRREFLRPAAIRPTTRFVPFVDPAPRPPGRRTYVAIRSPDGPYGNAGWITRRLGRTCTHEHPCFDRTPEGRRPPKLEAATGPDRNGQRLRFWRWTPSRILVTPSGPCLLTSPPSVRRGQVKDLRPLPGPCPVPHRDVEARVGTSPTIAPPHLERRRTLAVTLPPARPLPRSHL